MLSDRRHPGFRNFHSAISVNVIRIKSYMDSLFDPTCVPVRVTINKLNFFPNRKMPRFVSALRICGGLYTYVDDTFTVLGKGYVDGFLQHLNSQQLSTVNSQLLFVLPWKSRKITLSPFSTRQFQGIQTVFSPPLFTESPPTLTNT